MSDEMDFGGLALGDADEAVKKPSRLASKKEEANMSDVAVPDQANYDFGDNPIPDNFLDETIARATTEHRRAESLIASVEQDFSKIVDSNGASNADKPDQSQMIDNMLIDAVREHSYILHTLTAHT